MRIKQIELNGFKSFSDRTPISFHQGCTCIVGPNGCGKSNIVDAFRWVLGEQSAKSLRGEKMEEVIFQGSGSRKPKGLAEVSLIFNLGSSPGKKPGAANGGAGGGDDEASEDVSVSRRLYRSGESEYLLNRRACRLKDIRDIFLDTGLDVKSYSILDQGRITDVLNAKPQDRRFLIEEIAGVMKYKVRKAEALSKLESSKQNLQRINDIVTEVKRQMNSLDRQVKKAERYKRILSEASEVDLRIAKREYLRLSGELRALQQRMTELKETETAKRAELSAEENSLETGRIDLLNREKALAKREADLHEQEKSLAEAEKKAALLRNDRENRRTEISRLRALTAELDARKEDLTRRMAELAQTGGTYDASMDTLMEELSEKRQWLSEAEADLAAREEELEGKRRELFLLSEKLSNERNELSRLHSAQETLKYRESVSLKDMDSVRDGTESLSTAISEAVKGTERLKGELGELQSRREDLRSDIVRIRDLIEETRGLLSQERETLASNITRLESLKEMILDRSFSEFLSSDAKGPSAGRKTLSDLISADGAFESAIEAALSDRINSLVIESTEDLRTALSIVAVKDLGRTAFLYSPLVPSASGVEAEPPQLSVPARRGPEVVSLGNGSGESPVSATLDGIRRLLERIYIVRDLDAALEACQRGLPAGASVVTTAGEVVTDDGFIFAGKGKDVLRRKREIKDLQKAVERGNGAVRDREAELAALTEDLDRKRQAVADVDSVLVETEKQLSVSQHFLETRQQELQAKTRRSVILQTELEGLSQERDDIARLSHVKEEVIGGLDQDRTELSQDIEALTEALASTRKAVDEVRSHYTELRLSVTSYREKIEALRKEKEAVALSITELDTRVQSATDEIRRAEAAIAERTSDIDQTEESMRGLVVAAERLREAWSQGRESIQTSQEDLLVRESALRRIRTEIDALSRELAEVHGAVVEHTVRLENLLSGVRQKYDRDIAAAAVVLDGFDAAEDDERLTRLSEKIREIGPVNLGTLEEYDELRERHDFLSKQQQDLSLSISELEEAIGRINTTTRRKLREAYESLRLKFTEVFLTLFGGGEADLILTDPDNILEAGLDVIARPPGKKLQNLNLLSGGEKALTSLALLFAGFLIKPSPLCILDEVDAALDESNTVRFSRMLRELSEETQFIVITHNKATMEAADYLYGITMEEAGISKVMSLQFSDVSDVAYVS